MSVRGTTLNLRTFDGWGAVYQGDERVYEGDESACVAFVFGLTGVTVERDDATIAETETTAPTLTEALRRQLMTR